MLQAPPASAQTLSLTSRAAVEHLTHEHSLDQGAGGIECIGCHSCPCGVPPRHEVLPCQCSRASCDRGGHRGPPINRQIAVIGVGVAAASTVSFSLIPGGEGNRSIAAGRWWQRHEPSSGCWLSNRDRDKKQRPRPKITMLEQHQRQCLQDAALCVARADVISCA